MKISRTYRLSAATLTMIEELQEMTGAASATEIIEIAVARWHGAETEKGGDEMDERKAEYLKGQKDAHIKRKLKKRRDGELWRPTSKRQFPKDD